MRRVREDAPAGEGLDYESFIRAKHLTREDEGFAPTRAFNARLFPFQRDVTAWGLRRGRFAVFAERGLGKTLQQLEWSRHCALETGAPSLVLAPLAVAHQTAREGAKFGIPVTVCQTGGDVRAGVNVTNYDRLGDFDPGAFGAVALDESSILKAYMGATKRALVTAFAATPYRSCWTATPAPNDHVELGNHAEFLGIMPSPEMLSRWFINDTMAMGKYRLKGHAEADFWAWVASWAVSLRRPSDLGAEYSDEGYVLPPLRVEHIAVDVDILAGRGDDALFRDPSLSATNVHAEMRRTAPARAEAVAALVRAEPAEPWIAWCNTDYEADELLARLPGAAEVRGSQPLAAKEERLARFLDGRARVLIGKPSMLGYGLNLQHCARAAFVGLSYSFEQFYQALGRVYRFGQAREVHAYVIGARTEAAAAATVARKAQDHERMLDAMVAHSRAAQDQRRAGLQLSAAAGDRPMRLPAWLRTAEGVQ